MKFQKNSVRVFEVGPRDGLQNETNLLSAEVKFNFIEKLIQSGVKDIEVGAFVRADKIPQMADTEVLFKKLKEFGYLKSKKNKFWALVPNEKGLDRALESGCNAVAVFTGATESFTQKNIGMSIAESLREFKKVIETAKKEKIKTRAYISVCWGCPFEGKVASKKVYTLSQKLFDLGVDELSLGDTIGVAVPKQVEELFLHFTKKERLEKLAGHFHDTRGTAIANVLASLLSGVFTFDSSSAGLGGCNFAPGATGNVSSEDLVYMLQNLGLKTGINYDLLCEAGLSAMKSMGRRTESKSLQAWIAKKA
jgi:hydroxymethylglutaryl-CoA lyase